MTKVLEEQKVFSNPDAYKDIVFGIFAREDIYNYMGDVAIPYDTLVYTSGIDKDGHLVLSDTFDLPNGVYYLKELSTNGQYVLNDTEYDFEIAYQGQNVSKYVVKIGDDGVIENELARGTVLVKKTDSLDKGSTLEGVKFNLSAQPDMKNIIATAETNEDGIAEFSELELGKYYVQEAEQVDGYVLNDTIYEVEVKADGDLLTIECVNTPTSVEFVKVDEEGNPLEGASLQLIGSTGKVFDEWESEETPYEIKYLVEGQEYILHEVEAPAGYELAEDIHFTVKDGQIITMENKLYKRDIQVNKVDKATDKAIVSNAFEFTMYADSECTESIKTVQGNTEDGTALFNDITYGTYYIKETKAPKGYKLSDEVVKVEVKANGDVYVNNKEIEAENNIYSFVYYNSLLPSISTGLTSNANILFAVSIGSLGCIALLLFKKKKDAKKF